MLGVFSLSFSVSDSLSLSPSLRPLLLMLPAVLYISEHTLLNSVCVCVCDCVTTGFDELGGKDDFSTEMLEWRLGCAAVIHYSGNLLEPPGQGPDRKQVSFHSKSSIRTLAQDSSDSDD